MEVRRTRGTKSYAGTQSCAGVRVSMVGTVGVIKRR